MATVLPEIVVTGGGGDGANVGAEPGTDGVPNLQDGADVTVTGATEVLTQSSIAGLQLLFGEQWGVFLAGAPVILFDTFVSIDYRQSWNISDYPVERGAFESYNKVFTPFEARVSFASGGSEYNRAALLASVAAIAGTLQLYDVVTPEAVYLSVNVKHYDYHRTSSNGVGLIKVDLHLEEVRVTITEGDTTSSGASDTGGGNSTDTGGTDTGGAGTGNPVDNQNGGSGNDAGAPTAAPSGATPKADGTVSPGVVDQSAGNSVQESLAPPGTHWIPLSGTPPPGGFYAPN